MKQLIFKSLVFTLISILILTFILDPVFKDVNLTNKTFSDFYEQKEEIDVLILGSSHGKNTYNPKIIDSVFNSKTYNLSTGGQLLLVTNYLLDDVLSKKKPKLLIVDLYPSVMYLPGLKKSKAFQLRVFDNTSFSLLKMNTINKIYDLKEQPSVFSETIRNHDQWYDRNWSLEEYKLNKKVIYSRGFLGSNKIMGKKDRVKYEDFLKKYDRFLNVVPDKKDSLNFISQTEELNTLITYCKSKNIKLMLVSAPYFPSFYQKKLNKFHYMLNQYLKDKDIIFYDFNKDFRLLGLELNDFSNQGHLNVSGSNKVTTKLIREISKMNLMDIKNPSYLEDLEKNIEPRLESSILPKNDLNNIERTINRLLSNGSSYKVKHSFIKGLDIRKIVFNINKDHRIVIFESEAPFEDIEENYFLFSKKINEKDFDKRPKWHEGTNRNKLHWEVVPEIVSQDNKNYLLFKLDKKCEITNFDEVRIVLKDKYTKNSVADGKPLTLKNVKVIR